MSQKFVLADSVCVVGEEDRASNLASALARGLPHCVEGPGHTRKLALCGAAPSLSRYLDELRAWDGEVWAINGAYDFLLGHGIVPHGFVGIDPLPGLAEYVRDARAETTFYIAATCDPSVFDALKDHKVKLWFPIQENRVYPPEVLEITGGTTVLTRAPFLANKMGWRDITIFGADGSFEDGRYCYQDGTYGCDSQAEVMICDVNGQAFATDLHMLKQTAAMGVLNTIFQGMLKFKCGGMLEAFLAAPMHDIRNEEIVRL